MLFPDTAKNAISSVFYDKAIAILAKETTLDAEGGAVVGELTQKSTFQGNVQYSNLGELQTQLGLSTKIDIAITCDSDIDVSVDDILEYNGHKYKAANVIPYDSHKMITGVKYVG